MAGEGDGAKTRRWPLILGLVFCVAVVGWAGWAGSRPDEHTQAVDSCLEKAAAQGTAEGPAREFCEAAVSTQEAETAKAEIEARSITVQDFRADWLINATIDLDELGVEVQTEDRAGSRTVFDEDNWIVVDQSPAPGTKHDRNEPITLGVVKKSDDFTAELDTEGINTADHLRDWLTLAIDEDGDSDLRAISVDGPDGGPYTVRFSLFDDVSFKAATLRNAGRVLGIVNRSAYGPVDAQVSILTNTVDRYGNQDDERVYTATLSRDSASQVNWDNWQSIDWDNLWTVTYQHPDW